jgi:hypothetical protein
MAEEPVVSDPETQATLDEIEQARRRLGAALSSLRQRQALNPFNLRGWVQNHPVESALGAAVVGFSLAQPGRSDSHGHSSSLLAELSRSGFESALPLLLKTLL